MNIYCVSVLQDTPVDENPAAEEHYTKYPELQKDVQEVVGTFTELMSHF